MYRSTSGQASNAPKWEYGVYRVGGNHEHEWQEPDKRIYGPWSETGWFTTNFAECGLTGQSNF